MVVHGFWFVSMVFQVVFMVFGWFPWFSRWFHGFSWFLLGLHGRDFRGEGKVITWDFGIME